MVYAVAAVFAVIAFAVRNIGQITKHNVQRFLLLH